MLHILKTKWNLANANYVCITNYEDKVQRYSFNLQRRSGMHPCSQPNRHGQLKTTSYWYFHIRNNINIGI
jgi:hypothetical protein